LFFLQTNGLVGKILRVNRRILSTVNLVRQTA
jgi:hypothetical protein